MGRTSQLNGASVALELLPRQIDGTAMPALAITLTVPPLPQGAPPEQARAALAAAALASGALSLPLGPLATLATLPQAAGCPSLAAPAPQDELAAGRLPEALGALLMAMVTSADPIDPAALYQMALCLASLTRSAEADAVLALVQPTGKPHPAVLALRGYLAFQRGDGDAGRKALASAALSARGVPALRGILHFTQHVLLTQQFGG